MAGRPKRYKKKYCASLIEHMAQGFSYITWGGAQTPPVCKTIMYEWERDYPEWKEAKEIGYQKGLIFYEKLLTSKTVGITPEHLVKKGSTGIDGPSLAFTLRTRFHKDYGEKSQIEHQVPDGKVTVNFLKKDKKKDKKK